MLFDVSKKMFFFSLEMVVCLFVHFGLLCFLIYEARNEEKAFCFCLFFFFCRNKLVVLSLESVVERI